MCCCSHGRRRGAAQPAESCRLPCALDRSTHCAGWPCPGARCVSSMAARCCCCPPLLAPAAQPAGAERRPGWCPAPQRACHWAHRGLLHRSQAAAAYRSWEPSSSGCRDRRLGDAKATAVHFVDVECPLKTMNWRQSAAASLVEARTAFVVTSRWLSVPNVSLFNVRCREGERCQAAVPKMGAAAHLCCVNTACTSL